MSQCVSVLFAVYSINFRASTKSICFNKNMIKTTADQTALFAGGVQPPPSGKECVRYYSL